MLVTQRLGKLIAKVIEERIMISSSNPHREKSSLRKNDSNFYIEELIKKAYESQIEKVKTYTRKNVRT